MSPTITVTDADDGLDTERVVPRRVALPGDPEDMLIDEACRDLKLPAFRERFIELSTPARREQTTYKQFLPELLQVELADRDVRRRQRLLRLARFPRPKRLEDFDFAKKPTVTPEVAADLKSPAWVREGRPLVLIDDSATVSPTSSSGSAPRSPRPARRFRCTTTSALVKRARRADASRKLSSAIARHSRVDLLCLDEFGYLHLDRKEAKLLFQILTEREERKTTAVATNSPFTEWDKAFGDARLCAAIADKVTFRCTPIQTGTESYRFQTTQESLFPAPK
ncbi:ATP-binding protein [Streptomyces sp. NPDC048191]|uniref:ATP-binding protein n=1 Tax=Streptomyces sp. NPDC048191 TaxID=3155484 RepID=UPI0033FA1DA4